MSALEYFSFSQSYMFGNLIWYVVLPQFFLKSNIFFSFFPQTEKKLSTTKNAVYSLSFHLIGHDGKFVKKTQYSLNIHTPVNNCMEN